MLFIDPLGTGNFFPIDSINKILFDPVLSELKIITTNEIFVTNSKERIFQFICDCNSLFSKRFLSSVDEKIWNHIYIELLKEVRL